MLSDNALIPIEKFHAVPGKQISLKDFATDYEGEQLNKKDAAELLESGIKHLAEMQDTLYAHDRYRILIIFQAMDAAGKDSAVKHIMSGFNPLGVKVYSFKAPTSHELDHDYFWRHYKALPARGEIAIHNRSHYENVLVTRVHPEYILSERIPGIESVTQIDDQFWKSRYEQINRFESNLHQNGTIILKFFSTFLKRNKRSGFSTVLMIPQKTGSSHWPT